MGYDPKKLYAQALEIAKQPGVYFIEDIVALLPCSKPTFYTHFTDGSDELNAIKDQLGENRVEAKVRIRQKLERGEKAAELIALYKLIATDEERKALSMNHTDITSNGNTIAVPPIKWADE
jgi:AcrR family transcriptional regulator